MKYYFKTLWAAVCGRGASLDVLAEVREGLSKAEIEVGFLRDIYQKTLEQQEQATATQVQLSKTLDEYAKQMTSYQTLVENYSDQLKEKDAMIGEIRADYQRQINNYENRVKGYILQIGKLRKMVNDKTKTEKQ